MDHEVESMRKAMLRTPVCRTITEEMITAVSAVPTDVHPMTQFIIGLLSAQSTSEFSHRYHQGTISKDTMWQPELADGLHMVSVAIVFVWFCSSRT